MSRESSERPAPPSPPLRPRLRPLDVFPLTVEGREVIALRDPSGLVDGVATLPRSAALLLSFCDGHHDVEAIRRQLASRYGQSVSAEALASFVRQLDEALLLDSPRFQAARAELEAEFRAVPVRPAALAGRSYPEDPGELGAMIDGFFCGPDGAGAPCRPADPAPAGKGGAVRAIISPHIDYHRGGPLYGWAYKQLVETTDADLFVVFGTGHAAGDALLTLTRKAFATPFGEVPTDVALVDELAAQSGLGEQLFAEEILHRSEHSIEFQAVMLKRLLGDRPFQMLPVLCGSLHEYVLGRAGGDVGSDDRIGRFLEALASLTRGRRVALIAGADLAHIGPAFGDPRPPDERDRRELEAADRARLEACEQRDADEFFRRVAHDGDRQRICGLSAIYLMLRALGPGAPGRLLSYAQCPDPRASLVSCASLEYVE